MNRPQGYDGMTLEEKKAFWRANPLNGEVTIKVPGLPEFTMMSRNDDTVVKELYWTDYTGWEPTSLRLWAALAARASGVALDIGAYCGIYSILAATVNPGLEFIAVEIQPDCVKRIAENARRNGLTSIEPRQLAASNQSGTTQFFFRREPDILTSVASLIPSDYATDSAEVETVRLDEFLVGRGAQDRVSLIKIDVEGAELQTLDGLRETLAMATPDVLVEVNEFGELSDVRRRFPPGYHCFQIAEERGEVRRLRRWARPIGRNYLFTTDPKVSW